MDKLIDIYTKNTNNIFQSEAWLETWEKEGKKAWVIELDGEKAYLVKQPLRKGKHYLYVPRGPYFNQENWHLFIKRCKKIAEEEEVVFLRVEPLKIPNGTIKKLNLRKVNSFSPLSKQHSPLDTLLLDLSKSEKELLAEMKPKSRYNIKVAERKGVKVRISQKDEDLQSFYRLSREMITRGYQSFPYEHYSAELDALKKSNKLSLFVAEKDKKILAVLLVIFWQDIAIYLHGASSEEMREFMPNHLAQWEAIKTAKKRKCLVYDFWGIAPDDDPKHPWSGITRFKKGFGGEEVHFLGAYDYPIQKIWYNFFYFFNILRKVRPKK